MQINLNEEIVKHFNRLQELAEEAADDTEESFSARASAMTAVSNILKELTRTQAEVINMERLMKVEMMTIEAVKKHLTTEQHEEFLVTLREMLDHVDS